MQEIGAGKSSTGKDVMRVATLKISAAVVEKDATKIVAFSDAWHVSKSAPSENRGAAFSKIC